MKLLLLHGPAITESRKKLSEIKKGFLSDNIVVLENPTEAEIIENLYSLSLLSDNRLYIFENPPHDFKKIPINTTLTVVFWFDNQLKDATEIIWAVKENKGQVIFFAAKKEITAFPFIDALGFKDKNAFVQLQKLKDAGYDSQYIISMVFYLLRSLAVGNKKQRQNFNDILALYRFVLETDYKIKNGLIEPAQAEFMLVNRFLAGPLIDMMVR